MKYQFLEFSYPRYQLKRQLSQNPASGRMTYLALDTETQMLVVLEQFYFSESNPRGLEGFNLEKFKQLQDLNHPCIPYYFDYFKIPTGFCFVHDYVSASSLAEEKYLTVDKLRKVAIRALEILIDLEQQNPPLIHGNINPETILVEHNPEKFKVYLTGWGEGLLGWHLPGRKETESSDLFCLGETLGTLMTQIETPEEHQRETAEIHRETQFLKWIATLVEPNLYKRFDNAEFALKALFSPENLDVKPALVVQPPSVPTVTKTSGLKKIIGILLMSGLMGVGVFLGLRTWKQQQVTTEPFVTEAEELITPRKDLQEEVLKTRQCPECDLRGVNFKKAFLRDGNFWKADLRKANFNDANLENADLRGANLSGADLRESQLGNANLGYTNLGYANIENADFQAAKLWYANLIQANLKAVNFKEADLRQATLSQANLERANLTNSNLTGTKLQQANLQNANLSFANLENANLDKAQFNNATLISANLVAAKLGNTQFLNANLENANLKGAVLWVAQFQNANLEGANLENAKLGYAVLAGSNLKEANFNNAILEGVNLENSDLEDANLMGTKLERANLLGAYLAEANLEDANLMGADLRGATLTAANLRNVNFKGANLRGANLKGAKMKGANLEAADLKGTIMPNGKINP